MWSALTVPVHRSVSADGGVPVEASSGAPAAGGVAERIRTRGTQTRGLSGLVRRAAGTGRAATMKAATREFG